jgi:hypothetical protein
VRIECAHGLVALRALVTDEHAQCRFKATENTRPVVG